MENKDTVHLNLIVKRMVAKNQLKAGGNTYIYMYMYI